MMIMILLVILPGCRRQLLRNHTEQAYDLSLSFPLFISYNFGFFLSTYN
jgi:hypothetical protein